MNGLSNEQKEFRREKARELVIAAARAKVDLRQVAILHAEGSDVSDERLSRAHERQHESEEFVKAVCQFAGVARAEFTSKVNDDLEELRTRVSRQLIEARDLVENWDILSPALHCDRHQIYADGCPGCDANRDRSRWGDRITSLDALVRALDESLSKPEKKNGQRRGKGRLVPVAVEEPAEG